MGPNNGSSEHSNRMSSASGTPGICHMLTTSCRALADSNAQLILEP